MPATVERAFEAFPRVPVVADGHPGFAAQVDVGCEGDDITTVRFRAAIHVRGNRHQVIGSAYCIIISPYALPQQEQGYELSDSRLFCIIVILQP